MVPLYTSTLLWRQHIVCWNATKEKSPMDPLYKYMTYRKIWLSWQQKRYIGIILCAMPSELDKTTTCLFVDVHPKILGVIIFTNSLGSPFCDGFFVSIVMGSLWWVLWWKSRRIPYKSIVGGRLSWMGACISKKIMKISPQFLTKTHNLHICKKLPDNNCLLQAFSL